MTSPYPWILFVALGFLAAFLLDNEAFVPFFIVWGIAGIVLAVEADSTLKQRKPEIDNARPSGDGFNIDHSDAKSVSREANRRKTVEFSRY